MQHGGVGGVGGGVPGRYPFAGLDVGSAHVERADTDGILAVHGQEVSAGKHGLQVCT